MKGFVYILLCADGSFYTGSTNDLERRMLEHQNGEGANHTRKRLPVELVYTEEYDRIDEAYYRERQIHGWSRDKKIALIEGRNEDLPELAKSYWRKKSSR
jgi:putative endonuclease